MKLRVKAFLKSSSFNEDMLQKAKRLEDNYMNCQLFVQLMTIADFKTAYPKIKPEEAQPGDILAWGIRHYAILLEDDKALEVTEWGMKPQIVPYNLIVKEYDEPTLAWHVVNS